MLFVSTGSTCRSQICFSKVSGHARRSIQVKSSWLKKIFKNTTGFKENFSQKICSFVTKFNALSTLLTASLNLDPNRQEDNTSEIRGKTNKIKQAQMRITETCGSSDSRSLFFSHSMGSQSDAAIALLPSWKNTSVTSLQMQGTCHCKGSACIGHPTWSP